MIDDVVDDVKSASACHTEINLNPMMHKIDSFGYIGQLAGYAKALKKKAGGWWVVNKANGKFKYVLASGLDIDKEVIKLEQTVKKHESNKFERCFEPEDEMFRGSTGNKILEQLVLFVTLNMLVGMVQEKPSVMSKAQFPKMVSYVSINKELENV